MRKWRILFAGFVARMGNERLLKRVMLGELEGGKGYLGGQEQDWMCCLEHDLSLLNLPIEEKQWTLAAKESGKWFRHVEEATEQYMKRWFDKGKENVAKRRAFDLQNVQRLNQDAVEPKAQGGGRERSRVGGGVATAARSVNIVKATAET